MKDHTTNENYKYKYIGLCCFDYKLYEEEEGGGTRDKLNGYPYLKHIIKLWRGDWVKQMAKTNEAVGMKNRIDKSGGGGNTQFVLLQGTSSGNILGPFYQKLPIGLKDTSFGDNQKHLSVKRGELH